MADGPSAWPAAPSVAGMDSPTPVTPVDEVPGIVARARSGFAAGQLASVADRRHHLQALRSFVLDERDRLAEALVDDLGKPPTEAWSTEIGFVVNEIDHALDHLEEWTAPRPVPVPMSLRPGSAEVVPQPRGVATIIAPWNYPVQLLLSPLVAALAAGNTAVLKPSEVTPAVARVVAERLGHHVRPDVVGVVTGGVDETTALLAERVDHVFYTGNAAVGRIVMRAAAEHLTPVTLELGGKSPAIVTRDADVELAAKRIAFGKFVNAGQTCVAPDHVLVDRRVEDRFLTALTGSVAAFYGDDPATSPDYARIVNTRHHDRLTGLLAAGGYDRVVVGGDGDRDRCYLAPTVLAGIADDAAVMADEIFGPILPVVAVDDARAAVERVNAAAKPLALYVFTSSDRQAGAILDQTTSGGALVNHTLLHLAVPELPFGGVGESGMGAYHGRTGFDTFSHLRSVLTASTRVDLPLLYPPFTRAKQWLLRRLL